MPRTHTTPEETQRFHGERVEARQRERAFRPGPGDGPRGPGPRDGQPGNHHRVSLDETPAEFMARIGAHRDDELDDKLVALGVLPPKGHPMEAALLTALLLDLVAFDTVARRKIELLAEKFGEDDGRAETDGAEGDGGGATGDETGGVTGDDPGVIHADAFSPEEIDKSNLLVDVDHEDPPFFRFWAKLNAKLKAAGKPEAGYKAAHIAFEGGEPPEGTLTFFGKDWDGVRAVPAPSVSGERAYHGEFREVSDEGTVWRVVANKYERSIAYVSAEAALSAAKHAKAHAEGNNG